jgi:hypothetical protein
MRTGTPGDGSVEELFGELLPVAPRRGRARGSTALTSLSSRPALTRWARTQGLPVGRAPAHRRAAALRPVPPAAARTTPTSGVTIGLTALRLMPMKVSRFGGTVIAMARRRADETRKPTGADGRRGRRGEGRGRRAGAGVTESFRSQIDGDPSKISLGAREGESRAGAVPLPNWRASVIAPQTDLAPPIQHHRNDSSNPSCSWV